MRHSSWNLSPILVLLFLVNVAQSQHIIQTFTGDIGAGNSTFFSLQREGCITLILDSLEGDADIYVSQQTTKPDFENYDMQATTCGKDVVTIPSHYKRPVGIAIFGHVHSVLSKYTLTVMIEKQDGADGVEYNSPDGEEQEESLTWMVFVNILKIIFEILV